MIWAKPWTAYPSSNRYHQTFEYMFVWSKGKPRVFNPIKDRPVKYGKPWGKNTMRKKDGDIVEGNDTCSKSEYGMRFNVWHMNTVGQEQPGKRPLHPAQFPLALARDHILSWSNPGDTVFDPMMGSGTTGVAARLLRRNFVGIEPVEEYYELARNRIRNAKEEARFVL